MVVESHAGPLAQVVIFLLSALLAALGVQRLRWSPVVGYLIAGAVIGPHALGLVQDSPTIHLLSEFGIVFLLFTIGLELSLERLRSMWRFVFGLGGLQVALSALAIALAALTLGLDGPAATVVGLALALSSTAVVMRLMMDQENLGSRVGRRAMGVLLFQDIAVVPILLLVGLMADPAARSISQSALVAAGQAVLALALVIAAGRFLARPLFRVVASAQSSELFSAFTLLIVLSAAWLMESVGLSMAMGGFIAGVLLAETEYASQVQLDIEPFRSLLLGLFFIGVGMAIDPTVVLGGLHYVLAALAALLLLKAALLVALGWLFGLREGELAHFGVLLAQGGEFAFVVFASAGSHDLLPQAVEQVLIVVVGLSIALTPALAAIGRRLEQHWRHRALPGVDRLEETGSELEGHVVIAGYGRVGRTIARLLSEQGLPFIALDLSSYNIARASAEGHSVFYGNSGNPEALRAAGLRRASALVVTLDTPSAASRTVEAARRLSPDIPIIVRAADLPHGEELQRLGASAAVPETLEASLQLGGQTLRAIGLSHTICDEILERVRARDYAAFSRIGRAREPEDADPA